MKGGKLMDFELFKELTEKVGLVKKMGWLLSAVKGSGGVGRTFEKALGLNENYFEVPDYGGLIEIKAKSIRKNNQYKYVNLFGATPDSYLFEVKRIVRSYGYPHKKDNNVRIFNMSIYANKKICTRNHLFYLKVDYIKRQVVLYISDLHTGGVVDTDVAWSFEMLEQKLNRKLQYLLYIKAERKFEHNQVFFRYKDAKLYTLKSFEAFLKAIEKGYVRVTFKIGSYIMGEKYGQINDHGTSFDINEDYLLEVFDLLGSI